MKSRIVSPFLLVVTILFSLASFGCGSKEVTSDSPAADTSKLTVDEKIANIQKADIPAPAKAQAIAKLRAERGTAK